MRTPQRLLALGMFAAALVTASCAGSTASIEQSWRAPGARVGELTRVVTLCPSRNDSICRSAEDKLARRLRTRGIVAVAGYTILTPEDHRDRVRAVATLRGAGFDGVLTMRFVGATRKLEYTSFETYWGDAGGEVIPETVVRIEVNAYSLDGNRLIWSALSKSVDPTGLDELLDDTTELVSRELDKQRVIARTGAAST